MSTIFRKRKPRAPRAVATVAHPGQTSFVAFIQHVKPNLHISPQIRLLAKKVEDALIRKTGWLRLILVWPPRTGKTTAGSVLLLAWVFGLHPDWEAIVGSLSGKLATKIGAKVRQIIDSKRFAEVFGGVEISKHTASKTEFAVTHRSPQGEDGLAEGYFFASGRNTRATGQGSHFLLFDDLIGEKEADSVSAIEDAQEAIQMWRSRGAPSGFHWIINNTRYREDDPIGHILKEYAQDGPFEVIVIPSIVEDESEENSFELDDGSIWTRKIGDILWPYSLNVPQFLATKQGLIDRKPHEWYGQHKGMPRPAGGRELDLAWFKRYDEQPAAVRRRCDRVIVSVDPAKRDKETNDPTAILVWGEQGDRKYLLHVELDRMLFDALLVKLAKVCLEWKPNLLLMEQAGSGEQATQYLRKFRSVTEMLPDGRKQEIVWKTDIVEIEVAGGPNKILRFKACTPDIRQGFVWLPVKAPWLEKYESELVNFPRVSHDDQADATSQYLNWIRLNTAHTAPQASAPADVSRAVSPLGGIHSGRGGGGNFLTRW